MSEFARKAVPMTATSLGLALPLYAGISGVTMEGSSLELAPGITLEPTLVEILQTQTLAFALPADPSRHHPGPWSSLPGGTGTISCRVSATVTSLIEPIPTSSRAVYIVAALIRLYVDSPVRLALISDYPLEALGALGRSADVIAVETHRSQGGAFASETQKLAMKDVMFIGLMVPSFARLLHVERFHRSFSMFDQAQWCPSPETAMVLIWSAIENLFNLGSAREKTKSVARVVSDYLHDDRSNRDRCYAEVVRLYEERGGVVHAGRISDRNLVGHSFGLAKEIFTAVIAKEAIPAP